MTKSDVEDASDDLHLVDASDEETDFDVATQEYLLRFCLASRRVHLMHQFLMS